MLFIFCFSSSPATDCFVSLAVLGVGVWLLLRLRLAGTSAACRPGDLPASCCTTCGWRRKRTRGKPRTSRCDGEASKQARSRLATCTAAENVARDEPPPPFPPPSPPPPGQILSSLAFFFSSSSSFSRHLPSLFMSLAPVTPCLPARLPAFFFCRRFPGRPPSSACGCGAWCRGSA